MWQCCRVDVCDECGFEYDLTEAPKAGGAIIASVAELAALLVGGAPDTGRRPQPETWSPLEYGCHVRDALLVQRERVLLARRMELPSLEPMGRDDRVDHDGYSEQNADDVAVQLIEAARLFSNVLARLDDDDWHRGVIYSFPETAERSLEWVAVHTLHEVRHHLLDVQNSTSRRPSRDT